MAKEPVVKTGGQSPIQEVRKVFIPIKVTNTVTIGSFRHTFNPALVATTATISLEQGEYALLSISSELAKRSHLRIGGSHILTPADNGKLSVILANEGMDHFTIPKDTIIGYYLIIKA